MSDKRFTVVRLDLPLDAATFDTMVGADAEVTLHVSATHGQDQEAWQAFETAHAYHLPSARDDLPARWCAGAPLIARCPRLLAVSIYGAGYDTGTRRCASTDCARTPAAFPPPLSPTRSCSMAKAR